MKLGFRLCLLFLLVSPTISFAEVITLRCTATHNRKTINVQINTRANKIKIHKLESNILYQDHRTIFWRSCSNCGLSDFWVLDRQTLVMKSATLYLMNDVSDELVFIWQCIKSI
jgi:predicted nucleic-acid-binding Zn-ribbon protein